MIEFKNPEWLIALVFVPLLIYRYVRRQRQKQGSIRFPDLGCHRGDSAFGRAEVPTRSHCASLPGADPADCGAGASAFRARRKRDPDPRDRHCTRPGRIWQHGVQGSGPAAKIPAAGQQGSRDAIRARAGQRPAWTRRLRGRELYAVSAHARLRHIPEFSE